MSENDPQRWTHALTAGLAAACLALGLGLPIIVIESLAFFEEPRSLISTVLGLFAQGDGGLGTVLLLFSVVLPILKLVVVASRLRFAHHVLFTALAKWSLLDIFVVACLAGAIQFGWLSNARAGPAVFWFSAALALTSWLAGQGMSKQPVVPPVAGPRIAAWVGMAALTLGAVLPLISIEKLWLVTSDLSLLEALVAGLEHPPWGWLLAAMLIVFGFLAPLALFAQWAMPHIIWPPLVRRFARLQMLDVLAAAVAVLAFKLYGSGDGVIGWGAVLLATAALASHWSVFFGSAAGKAVAASASR